MCTGVEIALLVGAAAGTATTLYAQDTANNQQEANAKFAAQQAEADAKAAQGEAQVEAERIRRAAKAQRAQAVAQAAAAGVDVSSPTALKIDEEITKNSESDAYMTILNGADYAKRLNQQASADRISASSISAAGNAQAASTLLSGASTIGRYGSGWKAAKQKATT